MAYPHDATVPWHRGMAWAIPLLMALSGLLLALVWGLSAASPLGSTASAAPAAALEESVLLQSQVVDILLDPSATTVAHPGTVTVTVQVDANGQAVGGIDAFIDFDNTRLQVQSIIPGGTLSTVLASGYSNGEGVITYSACTFSGHPTSLFTLATVVLQSQSTAGVANMDVVSQASRVSRADYLSTDVTRHMIGTAITIIIPPPPTVPATHTPTHTPTPTPTSTPTPTPTSTPTPVILSADFVGNPATGLAPLQVVFSDTSWSVYGVADRQWNLGDGTVASVSNMATHNMVTHTYAAGTYDVSLVVTDSMANTDTVTKTTYINAQEPGDDDDDDTGAAPAPPTATPTPIPTVLAASMAVPDGGGSMTTPDGKVGLILPAGAVTADSQVSISGGSMAACAVPSSYTIASTLFSVQAIAPDGSPISAASVDMDIVVVYSDADLAAAGGDVTNLVLAYCDTTTGYHVPMDTTVDAAARTLMAKSKRFADWAVLARTQPTVPGALPTTGSGGLVASNWGWLAGLTGIVVLGAGGLVMRGKRAR